MLLPGRRTSQRIKPVCKALFFFFCISLRNPWAEPRYGSKSKDGLAAKHVLAPVGVSVWGYGPCCCSWRFHDAFMTLPAYTRTREGEVEQLGSGPHPAGLGLGVSNGSLGEHKPLRQSEQETATWRERSRRKRDGNAAREKGLRWQVHWKEKGGWGRGLRQALGRARAWRLRCKGRGSMPQPGPVVGLRAW